MKRKKFNKAPKLNLIPILDAIFIFIFFLLMSAQFIDIYEIGSDPPIVSTTNSKMDKPPLNLTLVLSKSQIIIKTGLDEVTYKTFNSHQLKEFNQELIELKRKNPTENSAILKPNKNFKYEMIVKVIDNTREITSSDIYLTQIANDNTKKPSRKLFDKIIFETQN